MENEARRTPDADSVWLDRLKRLDAHWSDAIDQPDALRMIERVQNLRWRRRRRRIVQGVAFSGASVAVVLGVVLMSPIGDWDRKTSKTHVETAVVEAAKEAPPDSEESSMTYQELEIASADDQWLRQELERLESELTVLRRRTEELEVMKLRGSLSREIQFDPIALSVFY